MTQLANISPLNSNPSQYEQQRNLTDESDFASANRLQAKEEDTKQWSRIKITIDSIGRFRCRKRRRRGGRGRGRANISKCKPVERWFLREVGYIRLRNAAHRRDRVSKVADRKAQCATGGLMGHVYPVISPHAPF